MSSQELNADPWRKELFSVLIKVGAEVAGGVARGLVDDYFSEDERKEQQVNIWRLKNQIKKIQSEQGPSSEIDLDALKSTVNYIDRQFQKPADLIDRDKLIDELDNLSSDIVHLQDFYQELLNPRNVGSFSIHNEIGPRQYAENIHIFVNGYYQGTLHVNRYFHKSSMEIYINREGIFNYEIFAECLYIDRYGQPKYDRARSIGDVYANVGSRFILVVTQHGIELKPW